MSHSCILTPAFSELRVYTCDLTPAKSNASRDFVGNGPCLSVTKWFFMCWKQLFLFVLSDLKLFSQVVIFLPSTHSLFLLLNFSWIIHVVKNVFLRTGTFGLKGCFAFSIVELLGEHFDTVLLLGSYCTGLSAFPLLNGNNHLTLRIKLWPFSLFNKTSRVLSFVKAELLAYGKIKY